MKGLISTDFLYSNEAANLNKLGQKVRPTTLTMVKLAFLADPLLDTVTGLRVIIRLEIVGSRKKLYASFPI